VAFEAYHELPISFMTSPSRKIDPATTIRDESLQAAARASASTGSIEIGSSAAIVRACAARADRIGRAGGWSPV
jgi:hypothetical protein